MPHIPCIRCSKVFYSKPNWIKKGMGKFCSAKCHHLSARTGKTVKCHACKRKVYKQKAAIERSKSGWSFCTKSCQTKWRNKVYVREKHANWKGGIYSYRYLLINKDTPKKCTLCEMTDFRVLSVHHIDENHFNNDIENLAWLCRNCHFLVHHDKLEKQKFASKLELQKLLDLGYMVPMV